MLYFLDVWIWEAQRADDSGGPSGDCCSLGPLCFHVQLLNLNASVAGELCFCAGWSDQSETRHTVVGRDGGQIKAVIPNTPLLDWRGVHPGACYWLMISPKEELEALPGMHNSLLPTQLHSWLHHKPANMAVVDGKDWPGMCRIPALNGGWDSLGNVFMFSIILTSCHPAWLKNVTGRSCQCAQHLCLMGSILGG